MIGELVEPFQFVFNPGRQLVEGVIIGGRILATWKREGRMECMWKVICNSIQLSQLGLSLNVNTENRLSRDGQLLTHFQCW